MKKEVETKRKKFAEQFRKWFDSQKEFKSLEELAEFLGIRKQNLYRYMKGLRYPSEENIKKLLKLPNFNKYVSIKKYKNIEKEPISNKANPERPYMDLAFKLRKWFSEQKKWKTQKEMAKEIGIPEKILNKFFNGVDFPKNENKEILYKSTKIELLAPQKTNKRVSIEEELMEIKKSIYSLENQFSSLREDMRNFEKTEETDPVNNFIISFYRLAEALEPLKESDKELRDKIKKEVPTKDVGYVVSFLKALYDEDKFSDFMFFTNYKFIGTERRDK